jgi:hypothetical protein
VAVRPSSSSSADVGGSRGIIRVDDEDGAILLSPSPSTTISSAEVDDDNMRNDEGVGCSLTGLMVLTMR